ncbi:FixH family protein [Motiliproteus sp. SC1-56]|uniref:FixH family protein n=1 Tax=Motiliproteus sp. SC1-56 TaxID=2799565 RepID=UPI001A909800|nr:FixH family protein [Motiliproteus sp. SC1-56]
MAKSQSPWRSPWVLGWTALLVVFFIANGVFIYLAQTNNPGLVVENYYERGQDYEKNMLKRRAADPGWVMQIQEPEQLEPGQPAVFGFELKGREGEVVNPDEVVLRAYRPVNAADDFEAPMARLRSGYYEAEVNFPLPGVWDLLVTVDKGGEEYSAPLRVNVGSR